MKNFTQTSRCLNLFITTILILCTTQLKAVTAHFTASDTAGCKPLVVHFTNTSTGATSYHWNFGDGNSDTSANPINTFFNYGTYTVTLTAYNGDSSATYSLVIDIPPVPVPGFHAIDSFACSGVAITFTNTTTNPISGTTHYLWSFGDGSTSTVTNPSHTYAPGAYYSVSLEAINRLGCDSSIAKTSYIHVDSTINIASIFSAPTTYFCRPPDSVHFSNPTTGGTAPLSYTWTFGDSDSSTSINPVHQYSATGTYTDSLFIIDALGCKAKTGRNGYITVSRKYAGFLTDSPICIYSLVTFADTSGYLWGTNTYTWKIGATTASSDTNLIHTFTAAGTYSVTLYANNQHSCPDTASHIVTVFPEPVSSFTISPTVPCLSPTTLNFNSTTPDSSSVLWKFGDGTTGTGSDTAHTYSNAAIDTSAEIFDGGYYFLYTVKPVKITMITTNVHGCKDTVSYTDTLYDLHANITANQNGGCAPVTINFGANAFTTVPYTLSAPYPDSIASYAWNFHDTASADSLSSLAHPSHTFLDSGIYFVTCTVTMTNGCTADTTFQINVGTPDTVAITYSPDTICSGGTVYFTAVNVGGNPQEYLWEWDNLSYDVFGDPYTSSYDMGTSEAHVYTVPGTYYVTLTGYNNNGCRSKTDTAIVYVDSLQPLIGIHYLCYPDSSVQFYNQSLGHGLVLWNFGDGTTSTLDSPIHNFAFPSDNYVTLTTYNASGLGCRDSITQEVNLYQMNTSVLASSSEICKDQYVAFTAFNSYGYSTTDNWYVNGVLKDAAGLYNSGVSPAGYTDTFHTAGTYTVTLVQQDFNGCYDTSANDLVLVAYPVVHFTVTPTSACNPLDVTFTDESTDQPGVTFTNYRWKFGDGTASASCFCATESHIYTTSVTTTSLSFTDTLIVTDSVGCKDSLTLAHEETDYRVHASFSLTPNTTFPCINTSVLFTNTSTLPSGDSPHDISLWNFGDGSATTTVFSPAHVFTAAGVYTVSLHFTDTLRGCEDSTTQIMTVTHPTASFYMDSTAICPPLNVIFHNTSVGATGYIWTLGDGTTSNVVSPTENYLASGTYNVRLIDSNSHGCKDTGYGHVNIFGFAGDFTYDSAGCFPMTVKFTAIPNNADTLIWIFGDGSSEAFSTGDTITHTYLHAGSYVPTLILTSDTSCTTSSTGNTIRVDSINTQFTINPNPVCPNSTVTFTDASYSMFSADTAWNWQFNGSDTSQINPATYVYTTGGTYAVTLTGTDGYGCSSSVTDSVTVYPLINISTIGNTGPVCLGTSMYLYDTVSGGAPPYTFLWSGPGGFSSTAQNPLITALGGTYTLMVTDAHLCTMTDTTTVFTDSLPSFSVSGNVIKCAAGSDTLVALPASGLNYTWSPATGLSCANCAVTIASPTVTTVYTVTGTNTLGCATTVFDTVLVNPQPVVGQITGTDSLCVGTSFSFSDTTAGGIWSIGDITVATVTSSGSVTTISVGTTDVFYTVSNGYGCTTVDSFGFSVFAIPVLPLITGNDSICVAGTTTLSNADSGGVWSSYNTSVAIVDPVSGIVTGVTQGSAVIAYAVTNVCGTVTITDTVFVVPVSPAITGVFNICSGYTATLGNVVAGGTWSISDGTIANIDPTTGVVTGLSTGAATVTYSGVSPCGAFTVTAAITVNAPTFISTNFMVACQSLTGKAGQTYILVNTSGCIKVCDSTLIRYYANGVSGAGFTWSVSGGTIMVNYGDSIDVEWFTPGITGNITLTDTLTHCVGSASICFQVIQRPHAYFIPASVNACLGSAVVFEDLSSADPLSPIVSYYWNFGDGTGSVDIDPTHAFITAGSDTVTLVVKNACGCSDTFSTVMNIEENNGPVISCASIVCDSQTATYTIPDDGCSGSYEWGVIGGTIVSGEGSASITVDWNNVDANGYGYVGVIDPCNACVDTSAIKIPVVLTNAVISGPDTICVGSEYEYTLPLWPATNYKWGVLGHPEATVLYNDDYKYVVQFNVPGTYKIHGWYENMIGLCGGNTDKIIVVRPNIPLLGPTEVCPYQSAGYYVGTTFANFTLFNAAGSIINSGPGTFFPNVFTIPGNYIVTATGNFCSNPLSVNVLPATAAIDSVKGADTVCLGRVYSYTAYHDVPGTEYNWQAIGGTVTPASGSATVNVIWNAGGAMQLLVNRTNTTTPPYCAGLTDTFNVIQEIIAPVVDGDVAPCANSYRTYYTPYTRAEVYDWSISPNTAGSVVSGDHTTSVSVLWNNVTGTMPVGASVVCEVHKCDSIVTDSLHVNIQPVPAITIVGTPNPVCPFAPVHFTASAGGSSYSWDFGDGSGIVTTTQDTVDHAFPQNTTSGNIGYTVKVTVMPNSDLTCPISGTAFITEEILPGPIAYASTGYDQVCDGSTVTILGTATDNVGTLTYQWYNPSIVTGATSGDITTAVAGDYTFKVTAGNGCSNTSNIIPIHVCTDGGMGAPPIPCNTVTATASVDCNVITLVGTLATGGTLPNWGGAGTGNAPPPITYNNPGIYHFTYSETFVSGTSTCGGSFGLDATIGVVPNFVDEIHCADSGMDSVFLIDYTSFLPGWHVTGFSWSEITLGFLGSGSPNLHVAFAAPGTYVVTEIVSGLKADSTTFACPVTRTIVVPGRPNSLAAFTYTVSPICEGIPILFSAVTSPDVVAYNWNFGDSSSCLLENPQRVFTWQAPNPPLVNDTVKLTVTDSVGCSEDTIEIIQYHENALSGSIGAPLQIFCANEAPVTLTFINAALPSLPAVYWRWSTGDSGVTSINVDTSGAYWVTVRDMYQCQATISPVNVEIVKIPPAEINGQQNYCEGQTVSLSSVSGAGIGYQWYVNGATDGTTSSVSDVQPAGDYVYMLVQSVTDSLTGAVLCSDTAVDTIHIHPLPEAPSITGPTILSCDPYHVELFAGESEAGTYNWSDGTVGATDSSITNGGSYKVWFTDVNGCQNSGTIYVPNSPELYLQYFPTGCYTLCRQQTPLTLYGPPDVVFTDWKWKRDGTVIESGGGVMQPDTITMGGTYKWALNNGYCNEKSGDMDISLINCADCGATPVVKLACINGNPDCYQMGVTVYCVEPGTTFTIGTNFGPMTPFTGTLATAGAHTLVYTFTTLLAPPGVIDVEVHFTLPDGHQCFQQVEVKIPNCTWESGRTSDNDSTSTDTIGSSLGEIASAMLVFPNPTSGAMTISYNFGSPAYSQRTLSVYDDMGRKTEGIAADAQGNWNLNTSLWTPGIYIIRMEADGQSLQTQRVVVTH